MATSIGLMKWMKTKLNGYKSIAVMPTEGRLTDTEILLGPSNFLTEETTPAASVSSTQTPIFRPNCSIDTNRTRAPNGGEFKPQTAKRQLNLEELECDVLVEGCPGDSTGQRQEFSFTLYDLDGHGKITKDDIASLVKTIYETLGQSIKVPHYGSKTIKVKLTVSPEKKIPDKDETQTQTHVPDNSASSGKQQQQAAAENVVPTFNRRRDVGCRLRDRRLRNQNHKTIRRYSISSSGEFSDDREADVSENDDEVDTSSDGNRGVPHMMNNGIGAHPATIYSKYKKHYSSLQRQELLQIIQENMEKNNLCFQPSRKPSNHDTPGHHRHDHIRQHHHARKLFEEPLNEQNMNKMNNRFSNNKCSCQSPHRYNGRPRCTEEKVYSAQELKHRHRVVEQARAREQVIQWLEKEFSTPKCNYNETKRNIDHLRKDRCEHHHVHEHVHHHYHHYQRMSHTMM